MGTNEAGKAKEKEQKIPAIQEQSSATSMPNNLDWSGFQAYSPLPPHGFMASSPQTHPYMWGVQHIMPAYGAPPHPYVAMYPPGVYAHHVAPGSYPFSPFAVPSPNGITDASGNTLGNGDAEGKSAELKEKLPIKRSKGSLGSLNILTGKNGEPRKSTGGSANGGYSISTDSRSDRSSEESDANSQNDSQLKSGDRMDSIGADASQNGDMGHTPQNGGSNASHPKVNPSLVMVPISGTGTPVMSGPATNLNIGMDYWGSPNSASMPAIHGKVPSAPVAGGIVTAGSRESLQSQLWLQDERELKRQRRKQSNRESARRSRLRKQAECDELAQRADALKEQNVTLRAEVSRIRTEYEQLLAENAALKERLGEAPDKSNDPRLEDMQASDQTEDA